MRSLLTSEHHPDVIEDQRRVLSNLISRLPLENLEDRVTQIVTGLCRLGGAGSNLVAKHLMQRLPPAAIVLKLLSDDFLQVRSSKFRENALQMVIFALLTFPSTYFDVANCVERTAKAALDRKKRVRQAALDVLAVLGQISSPKNVIDVVSKVAEFRKDGINLLAAVKARLARKQLPLVTADGEVQYALKIPTASNNGSVIMFGSDIEYISSGSGSVSPTSMKNRSFTIQSNGIHGQDAGRVFDANERRLVKSLVFITHFPCQHNEIIERINISRQTMKRGKSLCLVSRTLEETSIISTPSSFHFPFKTTATEYLFNTSFNVQVLVLSIIHESIFSRLQNF